MTNAMPSLQMTIKLSYGWRPFAMPSKEEIAFTDLFFNICNQFGIHYASASPKARFFVDEVTRVTWAHMHGEKAAPSFSAFAKSDISA